jgi:radical SAM enzyme (TIGR04100 family)
MELNNVAYALGEALYLNITNACPCDCVFCIRRAVSGVGDASSLWLDRRPDFEDVKRALSARNLTEYREIVFCGYGEPTCALDLLLDICRYLKSAEAPPVRLNTNGLGDLINKKRTPPLFEGLLDSVSVSLNAPAKEEYLAVTRPSFGEVSFKAMLKFASDCKAYVPQTVFSVVDVIGKEKIEQSRALAKKLGIPLRVRTCVTPPHF